MLKIKDDVDLKELEKFGFEKINICGEYFWAYVKYSVIYQRELENVVVWIEDRSISANGEYFLDGLYDLIQAGLVEKVGE